MMFSDFVSSLSEAEVRRELCLAYEQMERCIGVLSGEDTGPVDMLDNGESSDLELFYRCREARRELDKLSERYGRKKKERKEAAVPQSSPRG